VGCAKTFGGLLSVLSTAVDKYLHKSLVMNCGNICALGKRRQRAIEKLPDRNAPG